MARRLPLLVAILFLTTALLPVPAQGSGPVDVAGDPAAADSRFTGRGTAADPWVLDGLRLAAPNGTAVRLSGVNGHVVLRNLDLNGAVLVEAHDVEHLTVENVRGVATREGLLLTRIPNLVVRDVNLTARDTGLVVGKSDGDLSRVRVRGLGTGIVVSAFNGTVDDASLNVGAGGLTGTEVHANLTNLTIGDPGRASARGERALACGADGIHLAESRVNITGAVIHCADAGIALSKTVAVLTAIVADSGADGLRLHQSTVEVGGSVFLVREGGIRAERTFLKVDASTVFGRDHGIHASFSSLNVTRSRLSGLAGAAVEATGGTLAMDAVSIEDSHTGLRLAGVEARLGVRGGNTTLTNVVDGIVLVGGSIRAEGPVVMTNEDPLGTAVRLEAANGRGWRLLNTTGFRDAFDLQRGSHLDLEEANLVNTVGRLGGIDGGSTLRINRSTMETRPRVSDPKAGFSVKDESALLLRNVQAEIFPETWVDADDATVRHDNVSVGGGFFNIFGSQLRHATWIFQARNSDVSLDRTSFAIGHANGLRIEGWKAPRPGQLPNATLLRNLSVRLDGGHGLEVVGGQVLLRDANFYTPPGVYGTGVALANGSVGLLANVTVTGFWEDGIRWNASRPPRPSSIFPDPTDDVVWRNITATANTGVGLRVHNVDDRLDFQLLGGRFTENDIGVYFENVAALVEKVETGELKQRQKIDVCVAVICHGPQAIGLWSRWTDASRNESLRIRDSVFSGQRTGLLLWNHGPEVRVENNRFEYQEIDLAVQGNGFGAGPLIQNNLFRHPGFQGPGTTCQVGLNTSARFDHNNVSGTSAFCGVLVQDSRANVQVVGNRFETQIWAVAVRNASATVAGNRGHDLLLGGVRALESPDVVVSDNHFWARNETNSFVGPCGPPHAVVCFQNSTGSITLNRIFGPRMGVEITGPLTPEVHTNRIQAVTGITVQGKAAPAYDGANRIRGNHFELPAGETNGVAIADGRWLFQHTYTDADTTKATGGQHSLDPASGGMNVRHNTYSAGPVVRCHYGTDYWRDSEDRLKTTLRQAPYDCNWDPATPRPAGLEVQSHNFDVGADPPPAPRPVSPILGGTVTRPAENRRDPVTGEELPPCKGFSLRPVDGRAVHTGYLTFTLIGTSEWDVVGPSNGVLCDDPRDIRWTWLVEGRKVGEGLSLSHAFSGEGFFNVTFRAELTSQGHRMEQPQRWERNFTIYTGVTPAVRILAPYGHVFLERVGVSGGVPFVAEVEWGAGNRPADGVVIWTIHGQQTRTFGPRPVFTLDPGELARRLPTADPSLAERLGPVAVPLVAEAKVNDHTSRPATQRLKMVPFPPAVLDFVDIGDAKVVKARQAGANAGFIAYEWELAVFNTTLASRTSAGGGIAQKFEAKLYFIIKVKSTGEGAVGGAGAIEYSLASTRASINGASKWSIEGVARLDAVEISEVVVATELSFGGILYLLPSDLFPALKALPSVPSVIGDLDIDKLVRIGVGAGIVGEKSTKLEPTQRQPCVVLENWKCTGEGKITVKLLVTIRSDLGDHVEMSATGTGAAAFELAVPGRQSLVERTKTVFSLEASYSIKVWLFGTSGKTMYSVVHQSPGEGFRIEESANWTILPRTWTQGGDWVGKGTLLLANLTPEARPAINWRQTETAVAWVQDDLQRPWPRSGEVHVALKRPASDFLASTWWGPFRLTNDSLADSSPAVGFYGSGGTGRVVVAWVRHTNASLAEDAPLSPETVKDLEIMAAVPNWFGSTTVRQLTHDTVPDRDVRFVPLDDGLLVWRKNPSGRLVPAPEAPDEVWAAPITAAGTIRNPVLAFPALDFEASAYSASGGRLVRAVVNETGGVRVESTDLAGNVTLLYQNASAGAGPQVTLSQNGIYLAYERPVAGRSEIVRVTLTAPGQPVKVLANASTVSGLSYHDTFLLNWVEPGAEGSVLRWHSGSSSGVQARSNGTLELAGRAGSLGHALLLRDVTVGERSVLYEGANLEAAEPGAKATVTLNRTVPTAALGPARLEVLLGGTTPAAAGAGAVPEVEVEEARLISLGGGRFRFEARLTESNNVTVPEHNATLRLQRFGQNATRLVPVTAPAIQANGSSRMVAEVALPEATEGWWEAHLRSEHVRGGYAGVARLGPEWAVDGVRRDGSDVVLTLRNGGSDGSTRVVLVGEGARILAGKVAEVKAGQSAEVRLGVPAGEVALFVVANVPQGGEDVDQADFGTTVAAVPAGFPVSAFVGAFPAPAGSHALDIDLAPLAGVGRLRGAWLDGKPLALKVDQGRLRGTVDVAPCPHTLVVEVEDGVGGIRRLGAILKTPGEGCAPVDLAAALKADLDGGGGGPGGDPTTGEPPAAEEGGFFGALRRLIPAPGLALAALAVAAAALTRRRG